MLHQFICQSPRVRVCGQPVDGLRRLLALSFGEHTLGIAAKAVASPGLFERVATHREIFFNWSWMDDSTLRPGHLRIVPPADQVQAWRLDYESMRREMFFGDVPGFDEIMDVVRLLFAYHVAKGVKRTR
jgi:hypothetical protein